MTDGSEEGSAAERPVVFGLRLAESETFRALFREGMELVEETAAYLDGDGRKDAKRLSRIGNVSYATESMRLTSRLMQIASWLLLQRAVNEGELPFDQARQERNKVRLRGFESRMSGQNWLDLPERLRELIVRSSRLQDRVKLLDEAIYVDSIAGAENPVERQLGRLSAALGARIAR